MFNGKKLTEITTEDIDKFLSTRGKHKDTNHRLQNGDVMDILISGAKKIPVVSQACHGEEGK